ncbi:MAG TPA: glutaredoxin domain-containing protein [Burkholderiaceae bacterium]|jgi:glutaredoxin|nr:glutaredoxin domain-containing protein [Burkholderiaceae bacterium]
MSLQTRLRIALYALLALVALILATDRVVVWRFNPLKSNPPKAVVLYSAAWCGLCAQIRTCLKASDVPFEERDVEKSMRASAEWWALRVRGVPATLVGPELIYGFNTKRLTASLDSAGFAVNCWK